MPSASFPIQAWWFVFTRLCFEPETVVLTGRGLFSVGQACAALTWSMRRVRSVPLDPTHTIVSNAARSNTGVPIRAPSEARCD